METSSRLTCSCLRRCRGSAASPPEMRRPRSRWLGARGAGGGTPGRLPVETGARRAESLAGGLGATPSTGRLVLWGGASAPQGSGRRPPCSNVNERLARSPLGAASSRGCPPRLCLLIGAVCGNPNREIPQPRTGGAFAGCTPPPGTAGAVLGTAGVAPLSSRSAATSHHTVLYISFTGRPLHHTALTRSLNRMFYLPCGGGVGSGWGSEKERKRAMFELVKPGGKESHRAYTLFLRKTTPSVLALLLF